MASSRSSGAARISAARASAWRLSNRRPGSLLSRRILTWVISDSHKLSWERAYSVQATMDEVTRSTTNPGATARETRCRPTCLRRI